MRRAAITAVAGVVLALSALTSCGEFGGERTLPNAPANSDPGALHVKIEALMVDECYRDDPASVYPRCAKFITQLASTVGAVDQQFAGGNRADTAAAKKLRSGVDSYQQLSCDQVTGSPSAEQRTGCPRALRTLHDSLDVLAAAR